MATLKEKSIGSKTPAKNYEIGKGSKPKKAELPSKEEKWKSDQKNRPSNKK